MIDEFRRLLDESGTEQDRDSVADYAFHHARSELLRRDRHWCTGFSESPTDIASIAAGAAVTCLLPPVSSSYAQLRQNIASICRRVDEEAANTLEDNVASQIADDILRAAFDTFLNLVTRQCLTDTWREANPEIHALSVRVVKHIAELEGLTVAKRHRWHRIVRSTASRLAKPPMSPTDLERGLGTKLSAADGGARRRLDQLSPQFFIGLREVLVPDVEHGGYVYLLDLCRSILAWRSVFLSAPDATVPMISEADANRAYRDDLRRDAQREMTGFFRRQTLSEIEFRYWEPIVETAVEICSRPDFGSPDFAGMSQRDVFLSLADGVSQDEYGRARARIDPLVRRIRGRRRDAEPPSWWPGPAP